MWWKVRSGSLQPHQRPGSQVRKPTGRPEPLLAIQSTRAQGSFRRCAAFPKAGTLCTSGASQRPRQVARRAAPRSCVSRSKAPRTRASPLCADAANWLGRRDRALLLLVSTAVCGSLNSPGSIARTRRGVWRRHYRPSGGSRIIYLVISVTTMMGRRG
jgi:hypothetical protein